jgi:radical SAM superfamily enzyme YgiQ (UPF0313 family)
MIVAAGDHDIVPTESIDLDLVQLYVKFLSDKTLVMTRVVVNPETGDAEVIKLVGQGNGLQTVRKASSAEL